MEDPRLGVQPSSGQVVGDPDRSSELGQFIQGPAFGRSGVGRREHSHRLAVLAVASERLEQRRDAAAADEGHDEVDAVGRFDLGTDLAPKARLARRVRQERRVQQRDQRLAQRLGGAVRQSAKDRVQNRGRRDRHDVGVDLDELAETLEERSGDADPDIDSLVVAYVVKRSGDLAAQVQGDAVRGLGDAKGPLLDRDVIHELVKPCLQSFSDERLIEARRQLAHDETLRSRHRRGREPLRRVLLIVAHDLGDVRV